jgi:archaetidylinositol phosphate synthase
MSVPTFRDAPMTGSPSAPPPKPPRRQNRSLLEPLESPTTRWLATCMPGWVTPDMLTGLGLGGAIIAMAGYALSASHPAMLWLASVGIAVNWFGDSVDGNLARVRGIERPAYGFFIDNATDVFEYAVFALGWALSGYVQWELVFAMLAAFYMVMLLGLIKAQVTHVVDIAFGRIGMTEIRLEFILGNVVLFYLPPQQFSIAGVSATYPNLVVILWIAVQLVTFLVIMSRTLRDLAIQDPPKACPITIAKPRPGKWSPPHE